MIKPFNNQVLVKLLSNYKHALTTDARTVETKSKGQCVDISNKLKNKSNIASEIQNHIMDKFPIDTNEDLSVLLNNIVYFDEFEDTTNYLIDGERYSLIDIKDIKGYDL